jgi:hypothetical protein
VVGDYAYVAAGHSGLLVISVSDPANPSQVGSRVTPGEAWCAAVTGEYAYVADYDSGVRVISVSDSANPVEIGYYDGSGVASGVAANGDYAYVAAGFDGLLVYQFYGAGVEETPSGEVPASSPRPNIIRSVLSVPDVTGCTSRAASSLLDALGRKVMDLRPGANDVRALAPGVYFVRQASVVERGASAVTKVIITR